MDRATIDYTDMQDNHAGPGWLATSGLACRLGRHWPVAAIGPRREGDSHSRCADCGTLMERNADGRWMAANRTRAIPLTRSGGPPGGQTEPTDARHAHLPPSS